MISGIYKAKIDTPIGTKEGTLSLSEHDGMLEGSLHALGRDVPIENATLQGNTISFSGTLKVPLMGALPFSFEGEHEGDCIKGVVRTSMGDIALSGTRV